MSGPRRLKEVLAGWTPGAGGARSKGTVDEASAAFSAAWGRAVGEDVARRTRAMKFTRGVLTVLTASSAWSDELSLHAPQIIAELQRSFPSERLARLRFIVASGRTRLLLDGSRRSEPAAAARAAPQMRPRSDGASGEDVSASLSRLAAEQGSLDALRDRAGWKRCAVCERRYAPHAGKSGLCAPCAEAKRMADQATIERALMQAPWLSLRDVRRASPLVTARAYERTRQRLLTRWQTEIENAQRRVRRGTVSAADRVAAWSYLMLLAGLAQRDIGRAVVTDVLGREWMSVLFGEGDAQKQEAPWSSREKHKP